MLRFESPNQLGNRTATEDTSIGGVSIPAGTILIKHFEINTDEEDPSQRFRLETRFVVITNGDFYGITYRWRPDGSDADLLPDSERQVLTIREVGGGTREQVWEFPGRADCRTCHNPSAGIVLGLRTHQLNGEFSHGGTSQNQLVAWNDIGLFAPALDPGEIANFPKSYALDDVGTSKEDRVRSYLDANCAMCHHPGNLSTSFDLRYTTPLDSQNIVNGSVLYDLGVPRGSTRSAGGRRWRGAGREWPREEGRPRSVRR